MKVFAAFIFVIMLWSTTPLAIKWSGEGPGFLFGAASRMTIGLICLLPIMLLNYKRMPWNKPALKTYSGVALQIYVGMLSVYWAAQFIPSGWISVIFGLTPMMTALMAYKWLNESSLSHLKLLSYLLGFCGLTVMFGSAFEISPKAALGIAAVILAAFIQALGSIIIKKVNAGISAVFQVSGGLSLAVPLYLLTWFKFDGQWPSQFPILSQFSILYLGIIATTIGFILYFYILTHLPATKVALVTLVTPMSSLWLGNWVNHEPLNWRIILGATLIVFALFCHQFGDRRLSGK